MAEADWHLKDLLSFYVSKCRSELVSVSEDPVRAETMFDAVRRVREIMILMSCMVGAFTPSEIVALHRLDQIRLVAENEAAQMLRIGEDMALLRLWLKSAADAQWNVPDAVRVLRTGRLTKSSAFPEMTLDILTSVKKPFIVPHGLPANADSIRRTLRTSVLAQFSRAKDEPPFVPRRVELSFSPDDDSVILYAKDEFKIRGIFDHRRWTVIEAQILDDAAGAFKCRQVLQAISPSSIGDMCTAMLRMSTAQKLKIFQDEAISLSVDTTGWSSVFSVSKAKAGLGNGFDVNLFKRLADLDISVSFDMNFENGDFLVSVTSSVIDTSQLTPKHVYNESFASILEDIELRVHEIVLGSLVPELLGITYRCELDESCLFLHLPDHGVVIRLTASGSLSVSSSSIVSVDIVHTVNFGDAPKLKQTIDVLALTNRVFSRVRAKQSDGWVQCTVPTLSENEFDVVVDISEFFSTARSLIDSHSDPNFVCAFKKGSQIQTFRFKFE